MKSIFLAGLGIILMTGFISCSSGEDLMNTTVLTLPTRGSNSFLIESSDGYALVDGGMAEDREKMDELLSSRGVSYDQIKLLIVTHGHVDHVGYLAYVKERSGAPVICHSAAKQVLESGGSEPVIARNFPGRLLNRISPEWELEPLPVDVVFDREFDLAAYGIDGKLVSTPGHTEGSLTIVLNSGDILVGDKFRGKTGKLSLGMFYEDKSVLIDSLKMIASFEGERLHMSHGAVTTNEDLKDFIDQL